MQHTILGAVSGPAVAVPAAIAPVVGAHDAPEQSDAPQVFYVAGEGPHSHH